MRHEGGQSYTVRWFWKGKCWEAPATKELAHKAAPKQKAQAAKGRTVQQTATDQQQKTTTGPAQTTKATVPERYQDETPAEDQELARLNSLNRAIMEERRNLERLNNIFQAERREHEHLINLRQNLHTVREERRDVFRQQYPQHAHLLPPPATHRPPSPEPQQQWEKASSPTPQP